MLIAGLDIGTTGCKVTVYGNDGKCFGKTHREYEISRVAGQHELDPETVWRAVCECVREAAEAWPGIRAVGVTSFGESFVLLDGDGCVLMPAMLYTDPRGEEECAMLADLIGARKISSITGMNPQRTYSLPKLMWVREHRPDLFALVARVLLVQDFIVYKLTGIAQIDYSLASRTMAFDIRRLDWSDTMLAVAGMDRSLFSKPVPSGTVAGSVTEECAAALCLGADTLIVSCCHDQVAAAVGAGIFESGMAIDGTGTVECITPLLEAIPSSPLVRQGNYAVVPYAVSGKYVCYAYSFTGGVLLKWYRDNFAKEETSKARVSGSNVYKTLSDAVRPEPTGILVLPHFAGAATPYMDGGSKGGIVGLTLEHTGSDVFKAIMEGVTYEMLLNIEILEEAGIRIDMLRATGGGASSKTWLQIKADILNRPIVSLGNCEAGTVGSVMLTGVASGAFADLRSAGSLIIDEGETFYPDPARRDIYSGLYAKYRLLYGAIRPLV